MFVQVIKAKAKDAAGLTKQMDRWIDEIKPGAKGFLGSTGGITDDGTMIVVARFENEQIAQQNSDRPEQGKWWNETAQYLDGEATFENYTNCEEFQGGGSDDAGFVQVIHGHTKDIKRLRALDDETQDQLRADRPDVIGGLAAWSDDGTFTQTVYFTSEKEARANEAKGGEGYDRFQKEFSEIVDKVEFLDLREPRLN